MSVTLNKGEPKREAEVSRVLSNLFSALDMCQATIEQLGARIMPVMNDGAVGSQSETPKQIFSSPLAQEINSAADRVVKLNVELEGMRDRVEL